MLNRKRAVPLKPTPPPFRNHGNHVVALAELNRWLAEKAEEAGAYILTETTGHKLLVEDGVVRGVRTGDKGRDKDGGEKSNFEPGSDVVAKATVLAEGCWGHLTGRGPGGPRPRGQATRRCGRSASRRSGRSRSRSRRSSTRSAGRCAPGAKWKEFGGSWIYGMNREGEKPKVSIGFVVGLDHTDARLSVHDVLQEFKLHPLVRKILEGGKRVAWGAKAIPEGGYWAMPKLHAPGMVVCGDAGGMVNVPRLKGIHYAIRSGMLAAETIYRQLKAGSTDFSAYEDAVHESEIGREMWESRNMKQPFAKGLIVGGAITNAMVVSKGRFPGGHWATHRDADSPVTPSDRDKRYPKPDGKYTFDKLSGVFLTGNATRDDAPSHIRIQKRVPREIAEAWAYMCPAGVYEIPEDAPRERARRADREPVELRAVRRDHGQGRAADPARGRRRPHVPDHVAKLRAGFGVMGIPCFVRASSPHSPCCSLPAALGGRRRPGDRDADARARPRSGRPSSRRGWTRSPARCA